MSVDLLKDRYAIDAAGCWVWQGTIAHNGYGRFKRLGKMHAAHRHSYEVHKENIPEGYDIDHLCRVRACINPDHLEAVPHSVNVRRGAGWAGVHARKTECVNGHPLDGRNLIVTRAGHRKCRICQYAAIARYEERRRDGHTTGEVILG